MNKVIILGSSRTDGNTGRVVGQLKDLADWDVIDLGDHEFGFYDYEHRNLDDDFLPLIRRIIADYEVLVFATPVYWYAMSGIMKVFFDRITDLLDSEKSLGRKLRGKSLAALSCSAGDNLGENFWHPFAETAKYLGMNYLGHLHTLAGADETENLKKFVETIDHKLRELSGERDGPV
jgi:multimeric flavodoxin WrbA